MKKVLIVFISVILFLPLVGCTKSDALKFKEEYESINGETKANGNVVRTIEIDKKNPFVYSTVEEIVTKMKNEESFVVYFGFNSCPWCRSMITNLIKASKEAKIDKIYYVDVLNVRDTLALDENNNVTTTKEADTSYYELLDLMKNVLSKYTLTKDGEEFDTGEYRIYAPNVVTVKSGKATAMVTGISDLQENGYMDLTDEMNNESYNMLRDLLLSYVGTCDEKAC